MPGKRPSRKKKRPDKEIRQLVLFAGECCLEKKSDDVVMLDLRKISDVTDYFLIAGGYTDIHVRAVAGHVIDTLKERFKVSP
ncbi:MAG: RsfS/YbeB/iojap family protein, partial [Gemmatimonadota bacterium]|nr:RsfS/YbeB/iojap family protein [Gemmatimonadota bacterium]